jgi:N-glycosylase/DNA lyase
LCDCGLLFSGTCKEIQPHLTGVRFAPTKSKRIVAAREFFTEKGKISLKQYISASDQVKLRKWLADTIKGLGYKEASHFLRNIGFGDQLAILDRHILKNLKKFGVIDEVPTTLSKKKYLELEQQMKRFSKEVNIPLVALDLVFWSMETGKIFK